MENLDQILDLTHATKETKYLGNLISDIPHNCFFNKVLCGAGGTTLVLENDQPYVILVPNNAIADSKNSQKDQFNNDILFLYEGNHTHKEVVKYINKGGKKIMTNYHSLLKVIKALSESTKTPKDFRLLVDEGHMLTEGDDKDFMHDEVNIVLQMYKLFKSYCFMTATPFPRECFPDQLMEVPLVTAKWNPDVVTQVKIKAKHIKTRFVDYVLNTAAEHLEGKRKGNAYFFYNSVEAIAQIANKLIKAGLCTKDDIRVICADHNSTYLKKFVHPDMEIESVSTAPKKLNFLTAKAFEGCDIYDEVGVTYVCADACKRHSRVEIHTKLPQIVNRIRNSIYNEEVYLLYTEFFIKVTISKKEFMKYIAEAIELARSFVEKYKAFSKEEIDVVNMGSAFESVLESSEFLTKQYDETGCFINYMVNPNAGKRALSQWESANQTYAVFKNSKSLRNTESRSPLIAILHEDVDTTDITAPSGTLKVKLGGKAANFKKVAKDYLDALLEDDAETIAFLEEFDPLFKKCKQAFKGNIDSEFSASSFQRKRLEERLNNQVTCNSSNLKAKVKSKFKIGKMYTKASIKDYFAELYASEGLTKKAKATDICEYFVVKNGLDKNRNASFNIISKL